MAKILGLGGIFFKCPDAESYRAWWTEHMGVDISQWGSAEFANDGKAYTVFSPFKADTDYFAPSEQSFMINMRCDDARAMLQKAIKGGAKALGEVEEEPYGIFAWFLDPAGIKIELWEPSNDGAPA